jgi:diphthine synthase
MDTYLRGIWFHVYHGDKVESQAEEIYGTAAEDDVGFLVVGDPLCATTHTDMIIRARNAGCTVEVIHNASVMGASASCGLQLYQFGYTVSIPLFEGTWRPASFYDRIKYNKEGGMHTLCLLDIKVRTKCPVYVPYARSSCITADCLFSQPICDCRRSSDTVCDGMENTSKMPFTRLRY